MRSQVALLKAELSKFHSLMFTNKTDSTDQSPIKESDSEDLIKPEPIYEVSGSEVSSPLKLLSALLSSKTPTDGS